MQISKLPKEYEELSNDEIDARIKRAKEQLGNKLVILGHHYQRDDVIKWADFTGDSLKLCQIAQTKKDAKYIVFCGVHFMAESADMLSKNGQIVILPDIEAGCQLADMADIFLVEDAWKQILQVSDNFAPITYINSAADLKAFTGKNNGSVCTSSNAQKIMKYYLDQNKKILFFPDEHLGRYTALKLGIKEENIKCWNPKKELGGNSLEQLKEAKVILWKGFCGVHQQFTNKDIDKLRQEYPGIKVIVHPECSIEVCKKADFVGSTTYIIDTIEKAPSGSTWAIGTELHLVNRLRINNKDKKILPASVNICNCVTMSRITPQQLLWCLESILKGNIVNQIKVPIEVVKFAKIALDRMMEISK